MWQLLQRKAKNNQKLTCHLLKLLFTVLTMPAGHRGKYIERQDQFQEY